MTHVLVGIPTLNGSDRLDRCLKSIADCTDFHAFESVRVLICDDGSTEENVSLNKDVIQRNEKLRDIACLEMLVAGQRCGIAASWNKLVRHQAANAADAIAIINDDIEVVDDWLNVLAFSVLENRQAGMVGLNSYVGVVKQDVVAAGRMPLRIDYNEAQLLEGGGKLLTSLGSCFAFRRDVYDAVGGFDERYRCFYEEVDFGLALRHSGYLHYMASYPIVFHMGGATTSEPKNLDAAAEMARSRQLFREKWGGTPEEFRKRYAREPVVREWNTQLKTLKD